jgi:hypothetical protein
VTKNATLRALLARIAEYAVHRDGCSAPRGPSWPCTCGLGAVLETAGRYRALAAADLARYFERRALKPGKRRVRAAGNSGPAAT